jgi:HAD superfamily hydrolase (TIGR01509 family)
MHPRALIFDMDGTIIDSNAIWHHATAELLRMCNVSLAGEELDMFNTQIHSLSTPETCRIIKSLSDTSLTIEEMVHMKRSIAHSLYTSQNSLNFVTGFPEFHQQVKAAQIKSGVATNADEGTLAITDKLVNLTQYFGPHLYSIKEVQNRCKPHPDIYLHVADQLEVAPHECIAIEDSAHGIAAARAAGMRCIGINTGNDLRQLREANYIIKNYHDLTIERLQYIV